MQHSFWFFPRSARRMAFLLCLIATAGILLLSSSTRAEAQQTGTADFTSSLTQLQGIGFSEAFGESNAVYRLPQPQQSQVLNLLYGKQIGAGFSMQRLGITTDSNIEPDNPGSPNAAPVYSFDGSDGGQVWIAQQGQKYGLSQFIADAWSAPGYMKTNGSSTDGGYLCGVAGESCPSGDWRQAYANYLVQYARFYQGVGIPIEAIGFVNEPDYNVTYASQQWTPEQAVDFLGILGPTVRSSGLSLKVFCCDGSKWPIQTPFTAAIAADPTASSYVDVITSHEYGGHATSPQATTKPVWMTEWSSTNGTFEPRWDCGGCSGGPDGMYLAGDIIQAFNAGNVNAYLYWWGASTGPAALILVQNGSYTVAGRYFAVASFSHFVRPGAYRVSTSSANPNLAVVGFRNTDGSRVLSILNNASSQIQGDFALGVDAAGSSAQTYVASSAVPFAQTNSATVMGNDVYVPLPARSLTTVVLPPAPKTGTVKLHATTKLAKLGDGSYQAEVTIRNDGTGTAQQVALRVAQIDYSTGLPEPGSSLPTVVGSIAAGGFTTASVNFSAGAGKSGHLALTLFGGTHSSGIFGDLSLALLP